LVEGVLVIFNLTIVETALLILDFFQTLIGFGPACLMASKLIVKTLCTNSPKHGLSLVVYHFLSQVIHYVPLRFVPGSLALFEHVEAVLKEDLAGAAPHSISLESASEFMRDLIFQDRRGILCVINKLVVAHVN